MKKRLNNEHGLTLAELLATLVIGSLIIILIMSALVFVQKQFVSQKGSLQENTDISIALKSITRDARVATAFEVPNDKTLIITKDSGATVTYSLKDTILQRDNVNYIFNVANFIVTNKGKNKFNVLIESKSRMNISTEIVLRGGINDEK